MAGSSKQSDTKSEAAPAVIKATESLTKVKRDQDSKTKVNLKKPKKVLIAPSEKKKITKGFVWKNFEKKEMIKEFADRLQRLEAKVDLLVDLLVTKADLLATKADIQELFIPAKGAMKPPAKAASDSDDSYMDTSSEDESSSAEEPANKPAAKNSLFSVGVNGQSISVTGFDSSLPVDDIKSALSKYFSSFGEITRVFVPPSHGTGGSLGYAYVDLKEGADKALELGTHVVGGWDLVVGKAEPIRSGSTWPFPGRCGNQGHCTFC